MTTEKLDETERAVREAWTAVEEAHGTGPVQWRTEEDSREALERAIESRHTARIVAGLRERAEIDPPMAAAALRIIANLLESGGL